MTKYSERSVPPWKVYLMTKVVPEEPALHIFTTQQQWERMCPGPSIAVLSPPFATGTGTRSSIESNSMVTPKRAWPSDNGLTVNPLITLENHGSFFQQEGNFPDIFTKGIDDSVARAYKNSLTGEAYNNLVALAGYTCSGLSSQTKRDILAMAATLAANMSDYMFVWPVGLKDTTARRLVDQFNADPSGMDIAIIDEEVKNGIRRIFADLGLVRAARVAALTTTLAVISTRLDQQNGSDSSAPICVCGYPKSVCPGPRGPPSAKEGPRRTWPNEGSLTQNSLATLDSLIKLSLATRDFPDVKSMQMHDLRRVFKGQQLGEEYKSLTALVGDTCSGFSQQTIREIVAIGNTVEKEVSEKNELLLVSRAKNWRTNNS